MIHLLDRYLLNPHWRTIKIVGHAKILTISATTIIVAPLLSRTLIALNNMETTIRQTHPALDVLFPIIKLHFELPLSIKLVLGSAFCALVGKGIYEAACPLYIKASDSYEEFRRVQAHATATLTDSFLKIMQGSNQEKKGEVISGIQLLNLNIERPINPLTDAWADGSLVRFVGATYSPHSTVDQVMKTNLVADPVYYVLRDVMDNSRRPARVACALLYGLAILLLTGALLIQLWWAVRGILL